MRFGRITQRNPPFTAHGAAPPPRSSRSSRSTPFPSSSKVNALIAANSTEVTGPPQRLDPAKGNVCFASAQHGWAFTTASFAKVRLL